MTKAATVLSFSASLAILSAMLPVAGCKLIDQKTFDASVNHRPVAVPPPAPAMAPARPSLAVVRFGEPVENWRPELMAIVRQALARKPEALFRVQTVVPQTGSPAEQALSIASAVRDGGQPVAQAILEAGASSAQIDMAATTDAVTAPEVRVTVR